MEVEAGGAVERARSGDSDAFRLLVEQHSRGIFRLAFRMTGNEQDAEDVVQETFLRAYKQLDRYEARSSFSTWLYRIASNYSLDLMRMRKRHESRREHGTDEDQRDILQSIPLDTPGPDRLMYGEEVKEKVNAAMDELSAQERTAFVLRHFEGMCMEEVSRVLDCQPGAAKHSVFRAVQKLRRALEPVVSAAK